MLLQAKDGTMVGYLVAGAAGGMMTLIGVYALMVAVGRNT